MWEKRGLIAPNFRLLQEIGNLRLLGDFAGKFIRTNSAVSVICHTLYYGTKIRGCITVFIFVKKTNL